MTQDTVSPAESPAPTATPDRDKITSQPKPAARPPMPKEIGGPSGPEPTRYGDWEHKGRCSDF